MDNAFKYVIKISGEDEFLDTEDCYPNEPNVNSSKANLFWINSV